MQEAYPRTPTAQLDAQMRESTASTYPTPYAGQYADPYAGQYADPYAGQYAGQNSGQYAARYTNAYAGAYAGARKYPRAAAHASNGPNKVWVVVCACLIAVFTTFVLLDTFVIARIGQMVQQADLSSIVAAQGSEDGNASSDETENGQAVGTEDDSNGDPDGDEDGAFGVAPSEGSVEDDDSTSEDPYGDDVGSYGPGSQHGWHGGPGMRPGSTDSADNSGRFGGSGNTSDSTLEVGAGSATTAGTTVGTYSDENMTITVSQLRAYDTDIYVADIQVSSAEYLKTALAQNAYGRNLKDTTSNMADDAGAVLAINGDYYGFRDDGYVVRNGVLYRDTAATGTDALVVYGDGTMASASQDTTSAQQLMNSGAWQVLSFGPTLVENGQLVVSAGDEVDRSMGSNPRTAIGMVDALHYIVVVSDGRTGDNSGLSLYQLAQVMVDNGATYAYNLDGGGSTTLYFKGEVLNNPSSGNRSGEREVSDIVYFG